MPADLPEGSDPAGRGPDLTLHYGPLVEHLVDVRLPSTEGPRPVVVVVHGGFWKAEYDRAHATEQSEGFAAAGYVVATVEYRRVGQPGGGWPGTLDDVALVTDSLPGLLSDAVGDRVDLSRTVLVGHSAGGQLALWTASRHVLPEHLPWRRADPLPVRGVVSLGGVVDLRLAERLHLGDDAVRGLLGGHPDDLPERARAVDPTLLLPTGVAVALVHGLDDDAVPVSLSRSFAEQARAVGDPVELHELPSTGHMELIEPRTSAWPTVLAAVDRLIR